jgi:PEP-CTERM motif
MQNILFRRSARVTMTAAVLLLVAGGRAALWGATITDPQGDTFGTGPDILSITTSLTGVNQSTLEITVSFAAPIQAASSFNLNSLGGYLVLEANGNADLQAALLHLASSIPPTSNIDYYIDLFSEEFMPGSVNLLNANASFVAALPIAFSMSQFTVRVPVSLVGSSNPQIGAVVGTFSGASDLALQAAPTDAIPEPSSLALFALGGSLASCVGLARHRRRRATATSSLKRDKLKG